ncbi:MAG TPA: formimidoylglutamate deiminase, partial [Salinisphaeraceae bacterium]|nr:formimidoylglutamate deiminase [Salinisphaeraceae bacterium]
MELFARDALLPTGWARNVRLTITADGTLQTVQPDAAAHGAERLAGPLLPKMPNLHSHAFQRAMAGLAEAVGDPQDSFWSWRQRMYDLVARMTPEHMQAVAEYLYVEMLQAGYTSVVEFQYLHHDQDGRAHADPAENSNRLLAAAENAGLAMTLAPVLYSYSGFGAQPPAEGQRRFIHDTDAYLELWQTLRARLAGQARQRLALCFHSLRAVSPEQIEPVLALDADVPVHIHIAEQQREVDDCLAWSGQRPVAWLYDNAPVDARWCLIHATHITPTEVQKIASSGAVAGLCPTTEANLGDGIFPAQDFFAAGGRLGIGSDSHVSVSVAEELRWLEYAQRLISQHRNRLATADMPSVGRFLYDQALAGGAQALGQPVGR